MTFRALGGVGGRKPELPIVDGILFGEPLLDSVAAHELSAPLRNVGQPYVGVTTDGTVRKGLYHLADTGLSAKAAVEAARTFLALLPENERMVSQLAMESDDWRLWTNAFPMWTAKGLRLDRISGEKRDLAMAVVKESLSAEGWDSVRNCMKLNGALGGLVGAYQDTLTEYAYNFTIFGDPNGIDPWGWQLMGHHVDLNCVFVGTQLVLAPVFLGAEPNFALNGPYAGTRALDLETDRGLALRRALTSDQESAFLQGRSLLARDLPPELGGPFNGRHLAGAGKDNLVLPYEGIRGDDLTEEQRRLLLSLIEVYVSRLPAGHAALKRLQIKEYLDETRFVWRGKHDDVSAFYYRIHSPVLLVEYDNHPGIFLDNEEPERFHVHTIVREPNGNDYGKNLLAQHYALHHS
ncbi:DUF3500 domain-containing protein [Amycolatopsis pigmentata]|uniref:DUF3500 domain-containing protein n=1 Tax=Amycolatopsis pigmentata TaxID=450801 RepID=A0ABW5FRV1_9PSEU